MAPSGIGDRVVRLGRVGSTIDAARALAREGAAHGTVVVAQDQAAGRGRLGRTWHTIPGKSVAATVILRELPQPEYLPLAGMAAALAVVSAARGLLRLHLRTKWPNDVVFGGRKLAGVLAQRTAGVVLLSIGLNVNGERRHLPEDIRGTAATLQMVTGAPVDLAAMERALWRALDRSWRTLLRDPAALVRRWKRLHIAGERPVGGRAAAVETGGCRKDGARPGAKPGPLGHRRGCAESRNRAIVT